MKKIAGIVIAYLVLSLIVPPLAMAGQKTPSSVSKILVCTMIFDALGKIGDTSAVSLLAKGLNSKEFFIRAYAAQALGRLGDKKTSSLLLKLTEDKNYLVRVIAVKAFIKLGDAAMKPRLLEFLKDEDPAVRTAAVSHLTELGDEFMPVIEQVIKQDKDPVVRAKALEQLAETKEIEKPPVSTEGPSRIEIARRSLEDPDWQMRQAGCIALASLEDKMSIPLLIERLGDENPCVRSAAKVALAQLGETSLIRFFWQDINETNGLLKASSFIALAYLNDISVIPILLRESVAAGTEPLVRKEAVRALVLLEPELSRLVGDSLKKSRLDSRISPDNFKAVYRINGRTLAEIFVKALQDPKDPLHDDASLALRELRDPAVLPALREALSADDPDMVAECAFVLGELRDTQAVGILMRTYKNYNF